MTLKKNVPFIKHWRHIGHFSFTFVFGTYVCYAKGLYKQIEGRYLLNLKIWLLWLG